MREGARPAGRRDPEGAGKFLAEDGLRLVARRDVDQIARQQPVLVKGRGVALEPALVLETSLDEVERNLRQAPLGHLVQVFDIDRVFDPHLAGLSLKGAARGAGVRYVGRCAVTSRKVAGRRTSPFGEA